LLQNANICNVHYCYLILDTAVFSSLKIDFEVIKMLKRSIALTYEVRGSGYVFTNLRQISHEVTETKMPTGLVRQASMIKLVAVVAFILLRLGD
jgi:hypothetical protein